MVHSRAYPGRMEPEAKERYAAARPLELLAGSVPLAQDVLQASTPFSTDKRRQLSFFRLNKMHIPN